MKAMVLTKPRGPLLFLMNLTYSPGSLTVLGPGAVLVIKGRTDIATLITFLSATGKTSIPGMLPSIGPGRSPRRPSNTASWRRPWQSPSRPGSWLSRQDTQRQRFCRPVRS